MEYRHVFLLEKWFLRFLYYVFDNQAGVLRHRRHGKRAVRYAYEKHWAEIVAAVDIDPKKVRMDVAGPNTEIGVIISKRPRCAEGGHVVVHTTSSYLRTVYPQIMEIIKRRAMSSRAVSSWPSHISSIPSWHLQ